MKIEKSRTTKITRHIMKVLRHFGTAGTILKPGDYVEVSIDEAISLLQRGLTVEATPEEVAAEPAIVIAQYPYRPERDL